MKQLRVAIGAIAGVRGGPARYATELVRALDDWIDEHAVPIELVVLTDRPEAFSGLSHGDVLRVPLRSAYHQPWWDNVAVPLALRRLEPAVYHGTKHALPVFGLPRRVASLVTIHDLAVYVEPETFSLAQRAQLLIHLRAAVRRAERVICDSEHAAGDVAQRLEVDRSKIAVIPLGVGAGFRPLEPAVRDAARRSFGADSRWVVAYVGTWQPRKRIEVAVEAVGRLRGAGLDLSLLVAGRRRPGFSAPWIDAPPSWVRLVGELDDERLIALYGSVDVMVSPSTYEGFGLTFLEAMACGCPVVGIRATSVPEVVGEGGLLVDRAEVGPVAAALERLLSEPGLRAEKSRLALEQAVRFSWRNAAGLTARAYLEAAAGKGLVAAEEAVEWLAWSRR